MIIYGIYNAEKAEKIVNIILKMQNKTTWNDRLVSARCNSWYNWYLFKQGTVLNAINFYSIFQYIKG